MSETDSVLYKKYVDRSFEIDVAGHELLGHGSGKLLYKHSGESGYNFDYDRVINPLTGERIKTWYKDGESWASKFGQMASSYEECKAECVGLLFSQNYDMYRIFNEDKCEESEDLSKSEDFKNISYVSWLWMMRAGLCSLLAYNPDKKRWMQAHCQARYVIFRVMMEIEGFVNVDMIESSGGGVGGDDSSSDNFVISVNRERIATDGMERLNRFLLKLQVYKSTADYDNGKDLYDKYSNVDDFYLKIREILLKKREPRNIFAQPTIYINDGSDGSERSSGNSDNVVKMRIYPDTIDGVIESFCDKEYS